MATSMVRGRAWKLRLQCRSIKAHVRYASGQYYVTLPEVPPDTPETNPLLRLADLPKFSAISPNRCITGCSKLSIDHDTNLSIHIENLQDPKVEKTFDGVFNTVEQLEVPLNYAYRTFRILCRVQKDKGYNDAYKRVTRQVNYCNHDRHQNADLYYAVKEVGQDVNLTEAQRRLVDLYLYESHARGVNIQGKDKWKYITALQGLNRERLVFSKKVELTAGLFGHRIEDFGIVESMPRSLLKRMAEDKSRPSSGPWKVTLDPEVYYPFLEHCDNRQQRWNAWQAFNNRASNAHGAQHLSNQKVLEEIRMYSGDYAKLRGFKTYAEMTVTNNMAGSVENVVNMIETFKGSFKVKAAEEMQELQDFAASEGFDDIIRPWDVSYWRRRHREHIFRLDDSQVSEYFPLDHVLSSLFQLVHQLFGITIKEATGEEETWHKDVRYFKVFDQNGTNVSAFFFDPVVRPAEKDTEALMMMGRGRSDVTGTTPFSYLLMSLIPPIGDQPILMSFKDVQDLFREFGNGLQQMLTQVPYSELSGQNNVEQDAEKVCAKFLERWASVPSVVQNMTSNVHTGQQMPPEAVSTLLQAHKHMNVYDLMYDLYLAAVDMEMYHSKAHWSNIHQRSWEECLPLPFIKEDYMPCSFTDCFDGGSSALCYKHTWSQMIAADVFEAFEEVGLQDQEKLSAIGNRFRDTFLSLGGGVHASEVFRRFRGRDPSLDALQKYYSEK
ncbi:uncharacterized protein [Haliotis asinina]|uniref:uncharacterized protein n=1 Tax=Haliotis asinina TaxID=109174 RepID=UPI0035323826